MQNNHSFHSAPFHSMSVLRIYLKRGDSRRSRSWWERVFEKPLSTHLVHAALKGGIIHAAVNLGHMGFSKDARAVTYESAEMPMHTLPVCVELLAPKRLLEQFIRQEVRHLKDTTMVMMDGVHVSSLYIADLEQHGETKEHTVEYITGGSEAVRVEHVQMESAGEEATG
jgi:PII-like signaling protein